ncbi:hypothetical protein M3J09_012319 [Ascochyta lentis]
MGLLNTSSLRIPELSTCAPLALTAAPCLSSAGTTATAVSFPTRSTERIRGDTTAVLAYASASASIL